MRMLQEILRVVSIVVAALSIPSICPAEARWTSPSPLNLQAYGDTVEDSGFPRLATDSRGRWVAVWLQYPMNFSRTPYVVSARSADNGQTWSENSRISATPYGNHYAINPDIATDGNGKWLCVWSALNSDWDLFVSTSSSSDGVWTEPIPLHSSMATDTLHDISPRIATDGKGTWVVIWTALKLVGTVQTDSLWYTRSSDDGQTWATPQPVQEDFTSYLGLSRHP